MTEIVWPFERFPFFGEERRPVLASGHACCSLTKLTESGSLGDPCRVSWIVKRVECKIGKDGYTLVDFGGSKPAMEDFIRWLNGMHGIKIANALRTAHRRETPTTEDA
jgi:hypothetical protein